MDRSSTTSNNLKEKEKFSFWDIIFPPTCFSCNREDVLLCNDCRARLSSHRPRRQLKIPGYSVEVRSYGDYSSEIIKNGIHRMKYESQIEIGHLFGSLLAEEFRGLLKGCILVPIPLHISRERMRGFNQSEVIAQSISQQVDCRIIPALKRKRKTQPQINQDRKNRAGNVADCFERIASKQDILGSKIMIIDDVVTTGATVLEAAKEISRFKPRSIKVLAVALD